MICNKCNTEMTYIKKGNTCGWKCIKCDNCIVTTYIDQMLLDETIYTITIDPIPKASAQIIMTISKSATIPILEAKKLSSTGGVICIGTAETIFESIKNLKAASIHFSITPEFPY